MKRDAQREAWMWVIIVAMVLTIAISRTCDGQVIRPPCDCPPVGTIGC